MQPKLTLLNDEMIPKILEEAFELLQCPGIKVQNPEARDLLAAAGAKLYPENQVVGIPAALVHRMLESVPREFYLYDYDGNPVVHYGGNSVHFDPGSSGITMLNPETLEHETTVQSEDPLKWRETLIMWELPKRDKFYVVSVDASHGLVADNAAIEGLRVGTRKEKDEQVAEWCGDLHPGDLAVVAALIGRIYRDKDADLDALMAVECNSGSPGTTTQLVLQQLGYNNFYMWRRPHAATGGETTVYGWWTTPATRPLLTNILQEYLKKEEIQVNSPQLIEEMGSFVKTRTPSGKIHLAAFEGYHDDRLLALGISLYVAHEDDVVNMADERRRGEEARRVCSARFSASRRRLSWSSTIRGPRREGATTDSNFGISAISRAF